MPNILVRYFDATTCRIPAQPLIADNDLPIPDYPQHDDLDRTEIGTEEDAVVPVKDRWNSDRFTRRLGRDNPIQIPDDERRLLDGGIREAGIDVFAFYKSLRHIAARPHEGKWGIFYLQHGVRRVGELIEGYYPGYGPSLELAYQFLREHERFHFKFDLYALSVEATVGRSLYEPLKRTFRHHRIHQVEEALANRDAWDWAKQRRIGLGEFAYDFSKLQPGAYARFDEEKPELSGELAANLIDLDLSRMARRDDQAPWVGNVPSEFLRRSLCPEYFVWPASLSGWIDPAWKLPEVRHVTESKPVDKMLKSKYSSIRGQWEQTKRKLIEDSALPGLDFKPWNKATQQWSVRIDRNFRGCPIRC